MILSQRATADPATNITAFQGERTNTGSVVTVLFKDGTSRKLLPRPGEKNLPSSGFNWGNTGAGARHLAYCLLREFADPRTSMKEHKRLAKEVVSRLPGPMWHLEAEDVRRFVSLITWVPSTVI